MLESKLESDLVKWAESHGWITFKLSGQGQRGKPDRVFLHRGKQVIFFENKQKGVKLNKLQEWWQDRLARIGYPVYRIDNYLDGVAILETAGEPYG